MNIMWPDSLKSNQMALGSDLIIKSDVSDRVTIHFGTLALTMDVCKKESFPEETIGLPANLSGEYTIPADIPYEAHIKGGNIYFGPIIAHVVLGRFKDLNEEVLSTHLPRYAEYESIKGLVFICTNDSINIKQGLIKGYYYNPNGKELGCIWKYGRFPFPNAVFNRSFLSQKKIKVLHKKIGNTIFNSYWYNLSKWNLWKNLSQDELLREHLPYTEKYSEINQLTNFLEKYKSVYLKPYYQSRGKGIMNVSKQSREFVVVTNKNNSYCFKDEESIECFIKENAKSALIIQQAVPYKIGEELLDFRVFMQRDTSKEWSYKGVMARISKAGSIITNSQGRKDIIRGRDALTTFYELNEGAAEKVEKQMIEIVRKAIEIYENKGIHIGDIAADMTLDCNLHLWLLELQLNYAALNVPVPEIYKEITVTPFRYAKALAGF